MFDIGGMLGGMGGGGGGKGGGGGSSGVRTDKGWRPSTFGGPPVSGSPMGVNPYTSFTGEETGGPQQNDFFAKLLQTLGGLGLLSGGQQPGAAGAGGGGFQMPAFQRQPGPNNPVATQQYDGPIGPEPPPNYNLDPANFGYEGAG